MGKWKVTALSVGTSVIEKSIITYLTDAGKPVTIPRVIYYIEGEKRIVVDTGPRNVEDSLQIMHEDLTISEAQRPANALKAIGADPAAVDFVVLSHLHWDHCGNNDVFPNARFIVQRRELAYAMAPNPYFRKGYFSLLAGLKPYFLGTALDEVEGDVELLPGVRLLLCPGHSPGLQAVLVDTAGGVVCCASDAVMSYENLEQRIPPGYHWRIEESLDSMERLRRLSDIILPGHDISLFATSDAPTLA